jgi:hypothetical protein
MLKNCSPRLDWLWMGFLLCKYLNVEPISQFFLLAADALNIKNKISAVMK